MWFWKGESGKALAMKRTPFWPMEGDQLYGKDDLQEEK
jgi:hypothetical protein